MIELGTGLTILGSAIGGGKLLERMLGPTVDYVGLELRGWTEARVKNVARIFKKANKRLGDDINSPGSISPRILKEVFEEGSYCDDELMAEYYGGILASGRSPDGKDDRAASYLKLAAGLSTYQIRLHYITYTVFRQLYLGTGLRPTFEADLESINTFFPVSLVEKAMSLSHEEIFDIVLESAMGLQRNALVQPSVWGSQKHLNQTGKEQYGGRCVSFPVK